ncbi:GntR family transcriptional regulator [Wenjunlia tyrosinilytica]|nr:winged helix-turn-helix domain-containing protein [Wenjunlia tyrosinilytica]
MVTGEHPPGSLLPSEAQLIERYKVSRPTVRKAVEALRTHGLIDVIHGKGSFVRGTPASPAATLARTVSKSGSRCQLPADQWAQIEKATIYRTQTDETTGPLLELDQAEELFGVDRSTPLPDHRHQSDEPARSRAQLDRLRAPSRACTQEAFMNIAALALSVIALIVALYTSYRQRQLSRHANSISVLVDLFREHRGERMAEAREFVYKELPSYDPSSGLASLPKEKQALVRELAWFMTTWVCSWLTTLSISVQFPAISADQ